MAEQRPDMVPNTVPNTVQDAVDQYMEFYQVSKQLEERMQALRKVIEPFMKENGLNTLRDRNRTGKVQLHIQERAKMTSRYTTYGVEELSKALDLDLVRRCLVEVVDKDRVEALVKLGEISADLSAYKSTTPTYSLGVRFDK